MSERAWRRASLALALPILLLAACGPRADKPHPDQAAVLAFIDRYFSTWSARDMDGYGSCFHPSARIVFVSHGGGLQADTLTDFLHGQRLAHAQSDQPMTESATDIKLEGDGRLTQATVRWRLVKGAEVVTGTDCFTLVKTDGGWKIISLVFNNDK